MPAESPAGILFVIPSSGLLSNSQPAFKWEARDLKKKPVGLSHLDKTPGILGSLCLD
jgi:hypothetical protein